ncbi:DNA gyrase subunit A [Rubripirellula amarantea]|uniref:DNA topoisomerase (ATP-hydrolyzing) n=1 Tax=Rubripirellula amarantea TaxID=2527999 RepID=A0A5C5WUG5_9BACT|nr:DNA topoisomerase (ATP-hydrolyzing) [Rubripirellula amarantea]TWT54377.1 DNA gyrase subunit A [Rubripirellula amarantea]
MAKRRKSNKKDSSGKSSDSDSLFSGLDPALIGIPLRQAAQEKYLNYSLSVITSRALPDVRDGLKPVQRRILYTMNQQGLSATAKHRKCAKVVGDVMGNYHPHGDSSIYEALVRMSQNFSLRMPLVDGSGNFGSIDGDNAAAMRYTECRMSPVAAEILADLATRTVAFKANYDGSREEPVVLPSRVPNLLVNGATGIAVGMATNIPPHNLKEVCLALLKLLRDPEVKDYQLVANDAVQGPDFPTGGQITNTKEELREIYATGTGTIKLRGTHKMVKAPNGNRVLQIVSIPFGVNKATMCERIGELVFGGKLPLVTEVRDLSTDEIRVDLLLKKDADENKVLAFLYKNTQLQNNFNVNLTCLVPTENPEVGAPNRLSLKEILWHFLHFRLDVLTRRLENELASLERRIHILNGFALIFDALDEIIRIIRRSDGKPDAAKKIMAKFPADAKGNGLDEEQTDAILELKLYRLARLEINLILDELKAKEKRARDIRKLLNEDTKDTNASGRWKIIREEIETLVNDYGKDEAGKRRSIIDTVEEQEYTAEDFIVAEDCHVMVTRDGWIKRQKQIADPSKSRLRQGDSVLACVAGSTRETIGLFSSLGVCYTVRMADIPASTGFGEPIQKLFKMKDGEKIIAVMSFDPRVIGDVKEDPKKPDLCPEAHGLAATSNGFALRFGLESFVEASTRSGRRYARVSGDARVIDVVSIHGSETILAISRDCRAMVCSAEEINYLSGPGKGVTLIRLAKGDELLGFKASTGDRDLLLVKTNRGAEKTISTVKYRVTSRGGRGNEIQKNGKIAEIVLPPVEAPSELPS